MADFDLPALLDNMDNKASKAYASLPDRFYLIGKDGKIAFAGDKGPRGLKPDLLEKAIKMEVEKIKAAAEGESDGKKGGVKDAAKSES